MLFCALLQKMLHAALIEGLLLQHKVALADDNKKGRRMGDENSDAIFDSPSEERCRTFSMQSL
jgi:hypothetical protein